MDAGYGKVQNLFMDMGVSLLTIKHIERIDIVMSYFVTKFLPVNVFSTAATIGFVLIRLIFLSEPMMTIIKT